MTNYTKTTNFATKDSLPSGNANKIVKGTEIDTEFNNIATAVATKADTAGPTFTGTVTIPTADINGGAIDGTTIGAASASSIVGTTIVANTSINIAGDGATVTGIKDEDDMSSNSATKLATQQSIKAYVDSQVTAQDLDVTDGSSSIDIDLDSESLGILGGTGIDSTASGTGVTLAIDSTVATLTGSQTLTNKTLTAPTLTGTAVVASLDISGDVDVDGTLETDALSINSTTVTSTAAELNILDGVTATASELNILDGVTSTTAELNILDGVTASTAELNIMDGVTSTTAELNILDGVTSTAAELNILDGKAFLDEDDMSSNSATGIASQQSIKAYVDAQITAEDLDFQADSGGALSIDLDSETLTFTGGTGIDTSGSGNAVTFAIDSTVATLTGTQTLTNKTLTSPDINTPDIDGGTIDNTVIGGTTAAAGSFTTGAFSGNVSFADNAKAIFGAGSDLQIYHDGSHSRIDEQGTGVLFLQTNGLNIQLNKGTSENMLVANTDGSVDLYYDNDKKLETTSTGIDVTGSVTADGLTVDGTSTFSPNSGTLDIKVGTHDATNNVRLHAGGTTSTYLEYRGYLGHIFDVDTTRMMTLTSTGLGISTSDPKSTLEVKGTFGAPATSGFAAGFIQRFSQTSGVGSLDVGFGDPYSWLQSRASNNYATNFALALNPNGGDVGIGTDSPQAAKFSTTASGILEVAGTKPVVNIHETDVADAELFMGMSGGTALLGTTGDGILRFLTGASSAGEAMRIDSSQRLFVGKTSDNDNTAGHTLHSSGLVVHTRDASHVAIFNRTSDDGDVLQVKKDGALVGRIGTLSGFPTIGNAAGLLFNSGNPSISAFNATTNSNSDGLIDIGASNVRFRDLYLAGGAFIGGTGSANKLDDYEEGTWTPSFANGFDGNYTVQQGQYTKIGRQVIAAFHLDINSASTGSTGNQIQVSGLPFLPDVGLAYGGSTSIHGSSWATGRTSLNMLVGDNSTTAALYFNMCGGIGATIAPTYADIGTGNLLAVLIYNADT